MAPKRVEVEIEGRTLSLSNLDKPMYPEAGFTKGHVIDYYTRVRAVRAAAPARAAADAQALSGRRRGAALLREAVPVAPAGLGPHGAADYSRAHGGTIDFCLADDLPTLVWLANLADLELHTSLALARRRHSHRPSSPSTSTRARRRRSSSAPQVALELRTVFEHLGMEAFPKTSGSKGMQVYVPLNTPVTYQRDEVRSRKGSPSCSSGAMPELVVSEMKKSLRKGRVLVDWSQNYAAQDDGLRLLAAGAGRSRPSRPR